ncbi:MAG: MalY/PatB family protein [Ilumatobacteraceae bacterium]
MQGGEFLDALTVDDVRRRAGTKWASVDGRLAAWVADMDFPVASPIVERLVALANGDLGYPDWPSIGRSRLPDAFAERMSTRFGWRPDTPRLHELADVMQGVAAVIHHLTRPGDGIVLHLPAYHPFLSLLERTGRRRVDVPAELVNDGWRFDHDALDARLSDEPARVLLLCHPHNPTGHVFDRRELEHLAEIADRHDLVVVSDEIHAELVYPPHEHIPFAALGAEVEARTVTVTSSSKAFNLAGMRWAILHAGCVALDDALRALPSHYLGAPNVMAVAATEAAWSDGDAWQAAVAARLDTNRHLLAELLGVHLPGVRYCVPDATYLAWLDCRALGLGDDPATTFRERGVELSPGPRFGPQGAGFARLNFATAPSVLEQVVRAMAG